MSFEDQIRAALDGATASLRDHLEADLRTFGEQLVRASAEDRQRVVTAAAEERERVVTAAAEERQRLVAAAAEERKQAVAAAIQAASAEVRTQAEAQVAQIGAAAQKHAEDLKRAAEGQIGEMRKALDDLRAQAQQQLDAARRIAQAEVEKARTEIEKARAEADKARSEVEKARAEADKARTEAEQALLDAQNARSDTENARSETERVRGEIDKARAEVETARAETQMARGEADLARADTDRIRVDARNDVSRAQAEIEKARKTAAVEAEEVVIARLSTAHAASERRIADAMERAHTDSHQSELSRAARLADAIRILDEARGLSEVLERLAQCAGREVDRAAVLIVKGDRLAGWRLAGFGPTAPAAKSIDLSVEDAGLAGAVLESAVSASRAADASDDRAQLPPFALDGEARHAMALPVRVGGEVVAVLYADAQHHDTPSSDARWPAVLEVLVRHASRVLEAMTVQQAAGLSLPRPMARGSHAAVPGPVEHAGTGDEDAARRYARLLLSEIRMYHEPIVDAGRRSRDLMSRLHGEIERARRLYEARVPSTVPARSEYFDQELVRTLADGDRTLLGSAQ